MKDRANEGLLELAHLLAEEGSESHWLGYNQEHGWLLLDRSVEGNEPGIGGDSTLRFLRLRDWRKVAVPRSRWHDGSIAYFLSTAASEEFSKLQPLLLEWRKRRGDWVVPQRWKEVPKLLCQRAVTTTRKPPAATKEDLLLCFMWSNLFCSTDLPFEHLPKELEKSIGSYDASRLISARRAERCAAEFYTGLGVAVRDVSITQLTESSDGNWRDFDLDVGYPVDVKNSRATYNGRQHFSEHAVARFKEERASGREVRLVGVRSPYFTDAESATYLERSEVTVLGEVSATELDRLVRWMDGRFGHLLTMRLWSPKRLPGWIFEYPILHYSGREQAIKLMGALIQDGGPEHLLPGHWLVAEACGTALPANFSSEPWVAELRDLFVTCGLAKRCLIIYAMGATLRAVMSGEDTAPLIESLRVAANIGLGTRSIAEPLGLEDPLGFVDRFLSAFADLGTGIRPLASQIRMFHLTGPEVLVATMKDGVRWTMLAYCGGWLEKRGRCGSAPLVVGIHEHCEKCKHLICDDCSFCSDDCEQGRNRVGQMPIEKTRGAWGAYAGGGNDPEE